MNIVAEPRGLARIAKEAEAEKTRLAELARRETLENAQALKAKAVKLEKLARKDPNVRDLLEEHAALRAVVETQKEERATLEQKHSELSQAYQAQANEKAALQIQADDFLATAKGLEAQRAKLEADNARLGQDLEAARTELGKLKAAAKKA